MNARTTSVAGRNITIEAGEPSTVELAQETWEFWTLFSESQAVTGRCHPGSDPGERFRRMEGLEEYEDAWEIATAAVGIRPATKKAVTGWLNSHKEDALLATSCRIGSQVFCVTETQEGFQLE